MSEDPLIVITSAIKTVGNNALAALKEEINDTIRTFSPKRGQLARKRFNRMAVAWLSLADTHEWLDGVVSPIARRSAVTVRIVPPGAGVS